MASPSIQTGPSSITSAFSKPQPEYDVFLSFSGKDTRHQFTDHLYHALIDKEIITFKDDKDLKKGESISQELLDAIEKSRMAVIILSESYASSPWCLEELAKIVECRERGILTVLPIFYHVEPTDVRYQKKTFEDAFAKHEIRFKEDPEKVLKWRAALTNVANLSGEPLKDGAHEAKFIRSIVPWIYSILKDKRPIDIEDNLVGISYRVEDMISYLDMESTDVHFIGICGTSGMGKTTLAQAVFDKILNQFEACSFLENVTEESKAHGIKTLQERLLCDIGKGGLRVKDVHKGMHVISNILRNRKVLIVVDDVSEESQLEILVGKRDWFGQGSRIIVTTEDEDLLASYEIKMIYKSKELNEDEALQLFSLNAFRKPHCENDFLCKPRCENDFLEYIYNFVKYAHGTPLVLKVLGSYLCTRTKEEWERAQNQLRAISPEKTTKKLRIAFYGLGADERKLFLDIACFFKGEEKSRVANILESVYFSDTNLKNLIDKSLITLVGGKRLWMHPLLQQMGWEIVIKESKVAGGRSRLWHFEDVLDVLKNNTGTKHIEGMLLRLPPDDEEELNAESFTEINKLILLKMCKVGLRTCPSYLSNELRLLDWPDYPLESLPKSFQPGELVELIMHRSRIRQLPSEFRKLGKLKLVDLSYSQNLTHTPDFTGFSNIERLNFRGCTRLHELHPSFGRLKRLSLLNLKDCKRLKNLPHELNLESLKILILSGCSRFKKFPGIGRNMTSLLELYLDGTAIEELPPTIRRLTGLTLLNLRDCKNLKSFPSDIHRLTSLKILNLSGCRHQPPKAGHLPGLSPIVSYIGATLTFPRPIPFLFLSFLACRYTYLRIPAFATTVLSTYYFHNARHPEPELINLLLSDSFSKLSTLVSLDLSDCNLLALPDDLTCLSSLKCLNLSKNNFASLPDCISQLSKLKILILDHCSRLKSLPYVPLSTQFVSAQGCTSLENYSNQVVVWTSGVAGFTIINGLGLAEDEDGKIAEVSLLDIHPFWQRYVKDQIHQIEGFCHVLPQPEIPEWFERQKPESFAPIPLPSNLFSDINWKGIALCVIFVVPSNSNDVSPGQDTKYFHEFQCRLDIEGDLIVFKVPKETYVGSFGLWLYISHPRFRKHLNERSYITPLIGTNSKDIEIKMCGARILYKQNMGEFLQNLSQNIFGSPNDLYVELKSLLSRLYQVDWARNHLYDYIFPQIACPPRWFAYQNSSTVKMQLPTKFHDDSRWLGFTMYALYTTRKQRSGFNYKQDTTIFLRYSSLSASDEVSSAPYTAFPLSRDVFDESSLRLVVFYIPRLLFQLNRQCSQIVALFESNDPCVEVEKCGIRVVYGQDVEEFVQALVEYMFGSPDSFSKNLSYQLRMLQDCNHEKDYCCSFLLERRPTPTPKLPPSNETIHGECTTRETIYSNQVIAAGTSKSSSRGSIYLGKISSSLECWFKHRPYLQDHYKGCGTVNRCLPQSKIPEWFEFQNIDTSSSVTIPLPLNLYNNPDWMGFAFCAVFSFQNHLSPIRMKGSRFSFIMVCHLKTDLGCMNPLLWYGISEEDEIISLHQRAFLWISFIPCGFLSPEWNQCTLVEFSFVSDNSDVSALKCGVDLVYGQKLEFTRRMVQCITSYDGPFSSYERFRFYHPDEFSGSDGSGGTSGHYSYEGPYQFCKTAALDRYNNRIIFNQCIPQSEIPKWFSHDSLPSDLPPKFDFHPSTSYNFCSPPSKIQDWFGHQNHGCSATMDLPTNLYHNSNWVGLVLYASFSIHGDPNFILSNLNSGKYHFLYCRCQMTMANIDDQIIAFSTSKEEITWLLVLGEFIWISYVPGEPFKNTLQHCSRIEASFVSDWPGVIVQNCALQLLYEHDRVQFEQELKHCNNLISVIWELICKQQEDQRKINEQYLVDDGLQRKIFSNFDSEVKIFRRLTDESETDDIETQLDQSDRLDHCNQGYAISYCFPQREIPKWFSHQSTIMLPAYLYENPDWLGFAFCAVFSFHKQPTAVSPIIRCHLKTNLGYMSPLICYGISEKEITTWSHQRAFIWISLIPSDFLPPQWSKCTWVEFLFHSGSPEMSVLKCGVDLVYQHNLKEFIDTMVQCITPYLDYLDANRGSCGKAFYERLPIYNDEEFWDGDGSYEKLDLDCPWLPISMGETSGTSGQNFYEDPHPHNQFYKTGTLPSLLNLIETSKIQECGARLIYEKDIEEFVLSQTTFGSPSAICRHHEKFIRDYTHSSQTPDDEAEAGQSNGQSELDNWQKRDLKTLLSKLYQVDYARNHWYDYIFPQIASPPHWFSNQNFGPYIKMQLPSDLHDNSRWMGFTVYAIYTVQKQEAGSSYMQDSTILLRFSSLSTIDEVLLSTYTAFPLSRDAFDESSQRLLVFYIPRLLCEMNRFSHIEALFESDNPSLEVEMCGIRLVYEQDVEESVQTLVEYMLGSPDVDHPAIYVNLEVQLRKLQGCNHGKDFSCSFTQERSPQPMPKLLPSTETIQEERTPEIQSNAVGTSRNSSPSPICLSIPFFNGQCGNKMSSSLESWFNPYLQDCYNHHSAFNHCFPQAEIPEWFCNKSTRFSVRISLPPYLYDDPDWMGFAFCAAFSFHKHPTLVRNHLDPRVSHLICCQLKTNLGAMIPLLPYLMRVDEVLISLCQRAFIWVSFIPREILSAQWSRCTWVEFFFLSDSPDVSPLNCGVNLLYQHNLQAFTRTMVQCLTSYIDYLYAIRLPYSQDKLGGSYGYEKVYEERYSRGEEIGETALYKTGPLDFHPSTLYNFCFPPSKIQEWFSHQSHGNSVTIDLPSNLYHDNDLMGLALYASFSFHGNPDIILNYLVSGISQFLYCQCQTIMANVDDPIIACSAHIEAVIWLINLREFIWISYIPCEPFKEILQHSSDIKATFVSDWPDVMVQKCALRLLYQHDQVQFKQELRHCNDLILEQQEIVRKHTEDYEKKRNEQCGVDEKKIFSTSDFEVQLVPRFIDQSKTNENKTKLGKSDLLDFDQCRVYNSCFPLCEILEWFGHQSDEPLVTIPLPPNVFNDNTWMGLVLCASIAVEANPTAILDIQKSETTYNLICHLETNIECVEPLHVHHITEEDLKLLQQGGFIWLSYIPRGSFQESLNQCSQIEASVAINFPGLVQKSGFHLLYKHDEVEFKETIRQCMALFSNEHEVVPKVIDQSETNETKIQLGKSDLLDFDQCRVYKSCFPLCEIPEWFSHQSNEAPVTIPLPPNVYNDSNWMGLALCAYVAIEANLDAFLDIQNSETSYNLICHLETSIECAEPLHVHHITKEDLKLLQQGGFIWLSYIPRGSFRDSLNQCSRIEASVVIDFPGMVQKCGFHLLYKNDEVEFKETIRQCLTLFSNEDEVSTKISSSSKEDSQSEPVEPANCKDKGKRVLEY